jgi:hypothetical protein
MKRSRVGGAWLGLALLTLSLAVPVSADPGSDLSALFGQTNAVAFANDFTQGERVSLVTKLIGAMESLGRGNEKTTANHLDAFIHEVNALEQSGRLPSADAEALIDAANAIADQLD